MDTLNQKPKAVQGVQTPVGHPGHPDPLATQQSPPNQHKQGVQTLQNMVDTLLALRHMSRVSKPIPPLKGGWVGQPMVFWLDNTLPASRAMLPPLSSQ